MFLLYKFYTKILQVLKLKKQLNLKGDSKDEQGIGTK